MEKTFRAGFGRVNITPDFPCALGGFGNDPARFHNNVLDEIFISCIAVTDKEDTKPTAGWLPWLLIPVAAVIAAGIGMILKNKHSKGV